MGLWVWPHADAFRHAAICALDLGNKPLAIDEHVVFVEKKLNFDHADLPPNKKYEHVARFTMSIKEMANLLSRLYFCSGTRGTRRR